MGKNGIEKKAKNRRGRVPFLQLRYITSSKSFNNFDNMIKYYQG